MSKPCEAGCGRTISANKRRCLDCQAKEGRARLATQGVNLTHEEVKLGIRKAGGAKQSA